MILKEKIQAMLGSVEIANSKTAFDYSSEIIIKENKVAFSLDVKDSSITSLEEAKEKILLLIKSEYPDSQVNIILTRQKQTAQLMEKKNIKIPGAKKILAVSSGKGGVGKSTITALLAYKLMMSGKKIGIIDADIYGPSMPHIFGITRQPELDESCMIPIEKNGIYLNSIGFIVKQKEALNWRGPMASKALYKLLSLTKWPDLDVLLIDMPPGTGDIHLSLLQNYQIDGAVIVTTPQELAMIDVEKSIDSYRKFDIRICGIIENMSYYTDELGKTMQLFAGDAAGILSKNYDIPILSKVPILPNLSVDCDKGNSLNQYSWVVDTIRI